MVLILASGSPRRAELLRAAGFEFDVVVPDVDESIRVGESPVAYVRRLAAEKSYVVSALRRTFDGPAKAGHDMPGDGPPEAGHDMPGDGPREGGHDPPVVLGADTTVVVGGAILGKPTDDADAAAMLRTLSGARHQVLTGISLRQGAHEVGRVETTEVYFRPLTDEEVDWYVASGEGRDKAGAYAIQGLASRFIPRIDGSYANVVGLPVACVAELLRSLLASNL